jgi:hypothetical protein
MTSWLRRAAAAVVAVLCLIPFHRLLSPERNGAAGADAIARAEPVWSLTVWGTVFVVIVGVAGAVLGRRRKTPPDATAAPAEAKTHPLLRPSRRAFALGVGGLSVVLTGVVAFVLQRRLLTGVDEMASLIHARYLAAGMLSGPLPAPAEAWLIPNMLVTGDGWVSQYPPGHLFVWAAFVFAGLAWAAGPVLFGATAGLLATSFERLLPPERIMQARIAALLVAASPFLVILAGGSPSHATAGAAGSLALYAALRAAEGRLAWALAAGAAMGVMVLARPWTGLVLGPTLTLGVWLARGGPRLAGRALLPWVIGGVPFALLLAWYDTTLFGSPLTLGYEALYGPAHGLGLHADPWSFPYGAREALAFTASDVIQLGMELLETPVSLVLVGAAYLVFVPRLMPGAGVVAAWALLPIFAHALYWFHAPRMLSEAAPAWILLAVLGVAYARERADAATRVGLWSGVVAAALVGVVAFLPGRVRSQAWPEETLSRITVPDGSADGMLVFVHAAWDERLASMLQASGMRNDSIQPIIRRNDFCHLQAYADARLAGASGAELPPIDLTQTPAPAGGLISLRQPGGSVVWRGEGVDWPESCVIEMLADRYGAVALAPLLWQGDLPGLQRGEPMFVRDFGPARNEVVRALFPDRDMAVWAYPPSGRPVLLPYDVAMATFWAPPSEFVPPPPPGPE